MKGERQGQAGPPKSVNQAPSSSSGVPPISENANTPAGLNEHGGRVFIQGPDLRASFGLADRPDQVGHRGVPVVVPAPTLPQRKAPISILTEPFRLEDHSMFPALASRPPSTDTVHPKAKTELQSQSTLTSKMGGKGNSHVTDPQTPRARDARKDDSDKTNESSAQAQQEEWSRKEAGGIKGTYGTASKQVNLTNDAFLASDDEFDEPPPAPKRTRTKHRLDAWPHASPRVFASDTVLAAHRAAAQRQTALLQGVSGSPQRSPQLEPATTHPNPISSPTSRLQEPIKFPSLFRPSFGGSYPEPLNSRNARMGQNVSDTFSAFAGPGDPASKASATTQESDGSPRQVESSGEGAQNNNQGHMTGDAAQSFASNPRTLNPLHNPFSITGQFGTPSVQHSGGGEHGELTGYERSRAEYLAKHPEEVATSTVLDMDIYDAPDFSLLKTSDYGRNASEYSFQQMPGAFEPYASRNFDPLPPPGLGADYPSSGAVYGQPSGDPSLPERQPQYGGLAMSGGHDSLPKARIAPAYQPSASGYGGAQSALQEPQSCEPQHPGSDAQPRELGAQSFNIVEQHQPSFGPTQQPLMRPPPGFEQSIASFSVSEAQNERQIIRPPPGFEPRHTDVVALPPRKQAASPKRIMELPAPENITTRSRANQAPESAADLDTGRFKPALAAPGVVDRARLPANSETSTQPMVETSFTDDSAVEVPSESAQQPAGQTVPETQAPFNARYQAMPLQVVESFPQRAADDNNRGGTSTAGQGNTVSFGHNQSVLAHPETELPSLIPGSSDVGPASHESRRPTRVISPPRIVGGVRHGPSSQSRRRSSGGSRTRSPSPARRGRTPLQHTQAHVQAPTIPPPPGIIYMPSPYATARPARAGDETPTEHLNRLLMIAHQDGYMPKHLSLFNDTSMTAFEKEFPDCKLMPQGSMVYRMRYERWVTKNKTHVPPTWPLPDALKDWIHQPAYGAWGDTVDPRSVEQTTQSPQAGIWPQSYGNLQDIWGTSSARAEPARMFPASTAPIARPSGKGKEPYTNVTIADENTSTSMRDSETAMTQRAMDLSLRESGARAPTPPNVAGPTPREILIPSKLSAEATPFMAPPTNTSATINLPSGGVAGGGFGPNAPLASTTTRLEPMMERSTLKSMLNTSTQRRVLQQSQSKLQAQQVAPKAETIKTMTADETGRTSPAHALTAAVVTQLPVKTTERPQVIARPSQAPRPMIKPGTFSAEKPQLIIGKPEPIARPAQAPQQASEAVEKQAENLEIKIAWPNAPKPVVRPLQLALTETNDHPRLATPPISRPEARVSVKPAVKAAPRAAPKARIPEQFAADDEVKPSTLLAPPTTPPKFREFVIPATPTTPNTAELIKHQVPVAQDHKHLALPMVEEVPENPPIIKKSAKTSKRAVEKAAKKAKAQLARQARAEVASARLGMGKGVLEQIGVLPDVETDATVSDEEKDRRAKKASAAKKVLVKGIEMIPGIEINENHSKDVQVDRTGIKEKFVISKGQLKEIDLEKKARKEKELAEAQREHKLRAAKMKSEGKALASLTDDWEEEEDRIAAAEDQAPQSQSQSRRESSSGIGIGGPPVLMALGADFNGWKSTIPRPPPPQNEWESLAKERPDTAMSSRSNMSAVSSNVPVPFPSAPVVKAKDPSQFVEPAVIPPPLNRHIVPTQSLSDIIAAETALRGGVVGQPAAPAKPVASSWAKLAAGSTSRSTSAEGSRSGSEVIELRSRSASGVGNRNLLSRFSKAPVAIQSIKYDTKASNKRTVYILGVPQATNLTDISDSVSSGAFGSIYKIEFGVDADTGLRLAGILFRDAGEVVPGIHGTAWGAVGYYTALKNACDADYLKEPPLWPWPLDAPISVYLQEYPEEELMRRMHHDPTAVKTGGQPSVTRRLCLVNNSTLHRDWHEDEMIAFCYASGVKNGNVQKCCVHNFGNASIVFGSVEDAVIMRGKLLDKFKESRGMNVTFAACPGDAQGPVKYKRDNVYLRHLENTMGVDVEQEIADGQYRERKRRNSRWSAY